MNVGSLFSGIGGFDLGLERAGMRVVWQCEADEFCRRVLARHWPGVPCYPDVAELSGADVAPVDVLCGGFPCQDISLAGRGAGIDGARSGLWGEYARLIRELRPRYVVVENVSALLARGFERVLGDLAACGYDAEWDCLPASAFGAPHRRDRVWLVAYPAGGGWAGRPQRDGGSESSGGISGADPDAAAAVGREGVSVAPDSRRGERAGTLADTNELGRAQGLRVAAGRDEQQGPGDALREHLADTEREGQLQPEGPEREERRRASDSGSEGGELQDADERALLPWRVEGRAAQASGAEWWATEPPVGRVAHGVPDRLDQLAALGNALVPQIAEWLGRRILDYEAEMKAAA